MASSPKQNTRSEPERSETTGRGRRVAAFIRHGHFDRPDQTASAHQLLPLSAEGRAQAAATGALLRTLSEEHGLQIDTTVEASPLLRAWETAGILAEALGGRGDAPLVVEERPELMERGLGSCANLRFDQIERILALDPRLDPLPRGWRRIPDFRLPVPGAESLLDAGHRAARRIQQSIEALPGDGVDRMRLFVAHSGCLRHAAVHLGLLDRVAVRGYSMAFAQAMLFECGADGRWTPLAGEWREAETPPAPEVEATAS